MGMADRFARYAEIDRDHKIKDQQNEKKRKMEQEFFPYSVKMRNFYDRNKLKKDYNFFDRFWLKHLRNKIDSIYKKYDY